jgi:inner membrane transporter RhtA
MAVVRRSRPHAASIAERVPPQAWFVVSATFHYLGPAFAVLLFARVAPLGVAWLRIAAAAAVFALWRRPWQLVRRRELVAWGAVLAAMNCCFYLAIDRLPLGTVAAIEFVPVIALAALGARTGRNATALAFAVGGVGLLCDVRLAGEPLGIALAFANAALFGAYIVLGHRVAQDAGVDGLAAAMLVAAVAVTPATGWAALPALTDPIAVAAGVGVGIASSVIPYVCDQLAMAQLPRASYALLVALLPATAAAIGVIVLGQVPSVAEAAGVALVIAGVATHREPDPSPDPERACPCGYIPRRLCFFHMSTAWSALADPHRRAVLEFLRERPRAVGEIVDRLPLTQPGTSKHLRVLREAGLVSVRREGQRRMYALETAPMVELDAWLAPYRRLWSDRLDALERHLDQRAKEEE